jgi:hypothetical protein
VPTIGLIVEGEWDIEALSTFTGRLNSGTAIRPLACGGPVRGRYLRRLKMLSVTCQPDRVVVISDAHGRDHEVLAADIQREISHQTFAFPVHFVVLVQELEALLLADPRAIETICARRGTPIPGLDNLTDTPENIPDPKQYLESILRRANTAYTKIIAREIAAEANLNAIGNWCPSFRRLRDAVRLS